MVLRFVQLSDIHFGQERDGSLPEHDDVRKRLIMDAAALTKRGSVDRVLVVGDTAFSGKKAEFDRAGLWLDDLTKAVGCAEKAVRLVPGNHDCDRDKVSEVCKMVHEKIRAGTSKSAYGTLEKIAKDAEEQNPLLPKLRAYRDFASGYASDFKTVGAPFWKEDFDFRENGVTLRIYGMNSVQVCDEKDDQGKMILGNTQYILDAAPHVIPVVLTHHPLPWFMDKADAEPYLHTRAILILTGHEHIPKIGKVSEGPNERVDISSGATNPMETGPRYRHTYNWIEISVDTARDVPVLKVEIFARGWIPDLAKFDADTPRMHGAESIAVEIVCHNVKPRAVTSVRSEKKTDAAAAATPGAPAGATSSSSEAVMNKPDDDAAQLRFLFWRYLDWQQRLKVLVQADVLPGTADKPVSQTLERVALDNAQANGKLAAVWDAMTAFLPEAKRQPNPFKKT